MKLNGFLIIILTFFLYQGCESPTDNEAEHLDPILSVNKENINIIDLDYSEWPGTMLTLSDPLHPPFETDSNGIAVFVWNDSAYYHPVVLATMANWFLDSYSQTEDTLYLEWTLKYLDKLEEIALEFGDAKFFPYPFNYHIHGLETDLMVAPWYSCMAQGLALSAYSYYYKITGKKHFLYEAQKILNSYDHLSNIEAEWVSLIDSSNYLWFEEYPNKLKPNHTLNGFLYAIFGLYEFYEITGNSHSKFLLQASITTVKHYIKDYRVKGGLSYYCLSHKHQAENYHKLHINQLRSLYRITGDNYFWSMAELFYCDHH